MGEALLDIAFTQAAVSEVFAYVREGTGSPLQIASCGYTGSSAVRADLYSGQFHQFDPGHALLRHSTDLSMRFARVPASLISDAVYRRECFDRPGIFEKISFVKDKAPRQLVLNFYAKRAITVAEMTGLTRLAALALPLLAKHAELIRDSAHDSFAERLDRRLQQSYPQLTSRERETCAGTLLGKTAEAIGIDLGIAPSTVLTYRRRAYEKCRISSAAQMLQRLLDQV